MHNKKHFKVSITKHISNMIALVQMLGTSRRVRDAIGQLPVPVVGDASHKARVTNLLRHDFVLK